ncbi:MAG: hypothetical protein QM757_16660 [Paludibaculum sp.]
MSLSDGMQPDDRPKRRCSQRARPQAAGSIRQIAAISINQHLVPRLQASFYDLRQGIWAIARRERLPAAFVEDLLRRNSIPIRPEPVERQAPASKRRAA